MSSDNTTPSIQELIDECREQWANMGEGVLYLIWLPIHEGEDIDDFTSPDGVYTGNHREYVTTLCLTADNGNSCNGAVTLPRSPTIFAESVTDHRYSHPIHFFHYISGIAGALVISHHRDTLEPYLSSEGANQGDPKAWWIAYLFHSGSVTPDASQRASGITLEDVTKRTLLALEQLLAESLEKAIPFDGYLFIPRAEYEGLVRLSAKTVKEKALEGKLPIHPSSLRPGNKEKGYWVEQESVIALQRLKNERDENERIKGKKKR